MIASVEGEVLAASLSGAVIGVGGVGFSVLTTPGTAAGLRVGERTRLFTTLVVREDSLTLFGFADDDERVTFELLQSVTGVGPKLALAMLAVHPPAALARAVESEDEGALTRIPGVGKKSAARLILELKGKLGAVVGTAARGAASEAGASAASRSGASIQASPEMVAALVSLGWQAKQAEAAVADALAADPTADDAHVLRRALQFLGRARG